MVSQPNLNMYRPGSVARPAWAQVILLTANHAPLRFNGSSIARQLALSPMMLLAVRIEHPLDVTVQCSHDAEFGRVRRCIEQGNKLAAVRQHNRIVEATLPGQSSNLQREPNLNIRTRGPFGLRLGCFVSGKGNWNNMICSRHSGLITFPKLFFGESPVEYHANPTYPRSASRSD
jgi:hypothetical protein